MTQSMTSDEAEAIVESARKLLGPLPVDLHHVPNWLRRRILATFGNRGGYTAGWAVVEHLDGSRDWLDHWGSTVLASGREAFVSEPYDLTPDKLRMMAEACVRLDLQWYVSANSWWYPGSTVRIVILRPDG